MQRIEPTDRRNYTRHRIKQISMTGMRGTTGTHGMTGLDLHFTKKFDNARIILYILLREGQLSYGKFLGLSESEAVP
jgi:hypothetical protein